LDFSEGRYKLSS